MATRRIRADGEASRRAILDAAAAIAGERGYEGTSISLVSERSGLPASSIYWHFSDKDTLLAAVIDDSYERWSEAVGASTGGALGSRYHEVGASLARFPDFVRLGLLLVLEHRPTEPTARRRFVDIRATVVGRLRGFFERTYPGLDPAQVDHLARLTLALNDGYFVAAEAGELDLVEAYDSIAETVTTVARSAEVGGHTRGSIGGAPSS